MNKKGENSSGKNKKGLVDGKSEISQSMSFIYFFSIHRNEIDKNYEMGDHKKEDNITQIWNTIR